jgi:polysaccharide biosynthesis/export protein
MAVFRRFKKRSGIHGGGAGLRVSLTLALLGVLAGCATGRQPENAHGARWMYQQDPWRGLAACTPAAAPAPMPAGHEVDARTLGGDRMFMGPGDRLRIMLTGDEGSVSGTYVVARDGTISLPGLPAVSVAGLDEAGAREALAHALVAARIARADATFLDIRFIEHAGVSVGVAGAVFDPGQVMVGARTTEERVGQKEGLAFGDANPGRTISGALRAAGGLRPDADAQMIYVARGDRWVRLDLLAMMAGGPADDIALQAGDRIYVPSTGCFDARLMHPGALTTPGIRVYMSNLTRPAASNASSAIGKDTTSLPYGTRMLQALVTMNCVGGSAINSGRRAVLISRNPMTGQSMVVQREVEDLVRDADRDAWDPYLMPGDALACYDSRMSNFQDVVSMVGSAAGIATTAIVVRQAAN